MQNAAFFIKYRLHHLLFWMLVFGIWLFLRIDDYPSTGTAVLVTTIKVVDIALMIYITNFILIPRLLYKKRYIWFALTFIAMIMASSIFKMQFLGRILDNPMLIHWRINFKDRLYDNILPHFFLVIAGVAVQVMLDYGQLQKRMAETAREKAEAELNFLKSQINPHFLFNSLNAVYFLIDKDNTEARQALHKFSEMLRYQLYETNGNKIPVEKEIDYLRDYMDLQQLRKDETYSVRFDCADDVKGFAIEPLLLAPFVENAFKHLSHHTDKANFVEVSMDRSNGSFQFSVKNSREENTIVPVNSGGIGMANVKRRLELLYPGKHELLVTKTTDTFIVNLNLQLS